MCKNEDAKALSKVELILPANVVEACWNLKRNNQAFFFAVNEQDKTSSEINIHKLADNSVKIRVTVFPLNPDEHDDGDDDDDGDEEDPDESQMDEEPGPSSGGASGGGGPKRPARQSTSKEEGKPTGTPVKQYSARKRQMTPNRSQIASTVSKMKNVLGSPKKEEGMMRVMESDDEEEDYTADEEAPQASTIIIVKGPQNYDGQDDEECKVTSEKPATKKAAPRVHTVTMAGGKQIVYKGNKRVKVEKDESLDEDEEGALADATDDQGKEGEESEEKAKGTPRSKNAIRQAWKAVGVESQELESGDIIIDADELKSAAESFDTSMNDTEYNFDESGTDANASNRSYMQPGERKPRLSELMISPVQKVSCMVCGKVLQNYSYLYRHVKQFHRDIEDIEQYLDEIRPLMKTPCPICGKMISSVSNMSSHIVQCHPSTPEEYSCTICGGQYKTRISLKHHMQSQHIENRRRFPCKYCGATFTEVRSLKEHINCTHETTEVFCCEVCSKTFLTRGRLRRHMYIHGEYRLFCKFCGKGFHLKDNMNKHIELMHEKKHENRFKCEYCSKAFSVKGNLQQHVNAVHLKTLPYRCPICDEGYRKKGVMLAHMKTHSVTVNADGLGDSSVMSAGSMEDSMDQMKNDSTVDEEELGESMSGDSMEESQDMSKIVGEEPSESMLGDSMEDSQDMSKIVGEEPTGKMVSKTEDEEMPDAEQAIASEEQLKVVGITEEKKVEMPQAAEMEPVPEVKV